MEWAKAKNLEIILLIIVNLILFGLSALRGNEYALTSSAQSYITALLNNNNICLNNPIPKDYTPMRNLQLKPADIDVEKLKSRMFADKDIVTRSIEIGKVSLKSDYSVLTVENNSIKYNSSGGRTFLAEPLNSFDADTVRKYSQNIVSKIDYLFDNITLDTVTEKDGSTKLTYYEVYKGKKILDSFIKITVTKSLELNIEISVYKPQALVDFEREICSPDEALMTLIPVLKNKNESYIDKMDVVYSIESSKFESNTEIKSIPYYRIFIAGVEKPYLINAYLNRIKLEGEQYFHE